MLSAMWSPIILCVCALLGGVASRRGKLTDSILTRVNIKAKNGVHLPFQESVPSPSPTPAANPSQAVPSTGQVGRPGKLAHTILNRVKLPGQSSSYYTPPPPTWYPTQPPTFPPFVIPAQIPTQSPTFFKFPTPTPTQSPTFPPFQFPAQTPTEQPTFPPFQFPTPTPTQAPTQPPLPSPQTLAPRQIPTPVRHAGSVKSPARQPFNPLLNIGKYLRNTNNPKYGPGPTNTPQPGRVFPTFQPPVQPNPTFFPPAPIPTVVVPTFPPIGVPTVPQTDLGVCGNGRARVDCRASPNCANITCKAYPNAECRLDSCDNCRPQFFAEGSAVSCDTCRNGYTPNSQRFAGAAASDICSNARCGQDSHCYPIYCSAPDFAFALFECVQNCRDPVTGQLMGDGRRPECLKAPCTGVVCPNNYFCQPDPCSCRATCQFAGAALRSGSRPDQQTQPETDNTLAQEASERQTPETTTPAPEESNTSAPETTTYVPETQTSAP